MNSDLRRFKRALRRNLHCSLRTKRRLLEEFEHSLGLFLEDTHSLPFHSWKQPLVPHPQWPQS